MLKSEAGRKLVAIEVNGARVSVLQKNPDGSSKRNDKDLAGEAEARSASERMARDLISKGYVEQAAPSAAKAKAGPASGGDDSGTNRMELRLWKSIGQRPDKSTAWYRDLGRRDGRP